MRELFEDKDTIAKIQNKLPKLFHLAELESSRAGKVGMEVGSVREKIIVALFIYKFGAINVKTEISITETEVDVEVHNNPISIKTITGKNPSGVKLIWTVDAEKSKEFSEKYVPTCDMIFVQINWDNGGGFYYIPKETQLEVLKNLGRETYIKLPRAGTNPRGVEMSGKAIQELLHHKNTLSILIDWKKENIDFKPFQRWLELWQND
ncbi:MAG: type II restriction endonuclease subunit R [Candidatus Altiarchaeales archaeon HGW-Altiarchaeales-2]|nr:MAG: type II restriction endonuclease subunit R [Candidatus Altiarchaeales archaeon HGW-Altiarchaeales-2]